MLDPRELEVHDALGHRYTSCDLQLERAAEHFEAALARGTGCNGYLGTGRVLAELGRASAGLEWLRTAKRSFHRDPRARALLEEVEAGHWAA